MTRTAFFGTPAEAVPALAAVASVSRVTIVVTQPDRPQGRGLRAGRAPVAEAAEAWGLPVAHAASGVDLGAVLAATDVAVVVAYGRLIRPSMLAAPRAGFVNVHFSLLPRWRGASPVIRAILAGDRETGVTLMAMDEGLDTGPILDRERVPILPWDTGGTLTARLAGLGADLLARRLGDVAAGALPEAPQDDMLATAAAKVSVDEAFVDPSRHRVEAVERAVRAFHPRPGAWGVVDGSRLKLLAVARSDAEVEPGEAAVVGGEVVLGARDGSLRLVSVQPEGKRPMDGVSWMNGRQGRPAHFGLPAGIQPPRSESGAG